MYEDYHPIVLYGIVRGLPEEEIIKLCENRCRSSVEFGQRQFDYVLEELQKEKVIRPKSKEKEAIKEIRGNGERKWSIIPDVYLVYQDSMGIKKKKRITEKEKDKCVALMASKITYGWRVLRLSKYTYSKVPLGAVDEKEFYKKMREYVYSDLPTSIGYPFNDWSLNIYKKDFATGPSTWVGYITNGRAKHDASSSGDLIVSKETFYRMEYELRKKAMVLGG